MEKLAMRNVKKSFGGIHALKGVDFSLRRGEVHGLMGENGAGKSTLMKILAGAQPMDAGEIFIDGAPCRIESPADSLAKRISVIYQELNMAQHLSVAENIFLGSHLCRHGFVDWNAMRATSRKLLTRLGAPGISPTAMVKNLSIAQQQLVEIAKAVKNRSEILVFDEPSAVLGRSDSEFLFNLIRDLKRGGASIVYISHRLDEVMDLTDRITVLRDGANVATRRTAETTMEQLIADMTGKSYKDMWPVSAPTQSNAPVALEVRNLRCGRRVRGVSFSIRQGEVLGLAGLVGSGRTEIARCLFGVDIPDSGDIIVNGEKRRITSPGVAMQNGMGFVMEDRKSLGLLLERPIRENITITGLLRYAFWGWIDKKREANEAQRFREMLGIKTNNLNNPVKSLSGGNQQKVAIAKWLHINPDILILDEPTRGVDVGAKAEIYRIIENMKAAKKAIILISSEFVEIMALSTRIVVIRDGKSVKEMSRNEASQGDTLLTSMSRQIIVEQQS